MNKVKDLLNEVGAEYLASATLKDNNTIKKEFQETEEKSLDWYFLSSARLKRWNSWIIKYHPDASAELINIVMEQWYLGNEPPDTGEPPIALAELKSK